jgi:hypothetical protein
VGGNPSRRRPYTHGRGVHSSAAKTEAAPSPAEISKVRALIRRLEADLADLPDDERVQITDACTVVRKTRQVVQLGMPAVPAATIDLRAIGRTG